MVTAMAQVRSLAQELPHAVDRAKRKERNASNYFRQKCLLWRVNRGLEMLGGGGECIQGSEALARVPPSPGLSGSRPGDTENHPGSFLVLNTALCDSLPCRVFIAQQEIRKP